MKPIFILVCTVLLLAAPLSEAAKPKKKTLRWSESDGEIVLDTVCEEFAYGSLDYRQCRAAAKRLFEERCRDYQKSAERAGGTLRESLQQKRDMYCVAASQFGAVN